MQLGVPVLHSYPAHPRVPQASGGAFVAPHLPRGFAALSFGAVGTRRMATDSRHSGAALRNRQPILEVLQEILPKEGQAK